jgi:hypothetical protein
MATDSTERRRRTMSELTNLESKLAEVLGLASAAKGAAEKVNGMLDEDPETQLRPERRRH